MLASLPGRGSFRHIRVGRIASLFRGGSVDGRGDWSPQSPTMIHLRGYLALSLLFTGCVRTRWPIPARARPAAAAPRRARARRPPGRAATSPAGLAGRAAAAGSSSSSGEAPAACGTGWSRARRPATTRATSRSTAATGIRLTATELWTQRTAGRRRTTRRTRSRWTRTAISTWRDMSATTGATRCCASSIRRVRSC